MDMKKDLPRERQVFLVCRGRHGAGRGGAYREGGPGGPPLVFHSRVYRIFAICPRVMLDWGRKVPSA